LNSIKINGDETFGGTEDITLSAEKNDLAFSFIGISFKDEESVNYRFRLNGYNSEWQYLPSNDYPNTRYTNLEFGDYTFELQARNRDEPWSESVFSGKITIKRAFTESPLFYGLSFLATLVIGFLISSYFNQRNIQLKLKSVIDEKISEIEASKNELKKKNDDLMSSIMYAQRIQNAILTSQSKIAQTLPNHFILYKPKDVVSGDFYWCEQIDSKCFIVVGDCTGHGVPGAFMTMLATQSLNDIIIQKKIYEPDKILEQLDKWFTKLLRQESHQISDGMDVVICVTYENSNQIRFAGAKSSIVMVCNQQLTEYKGDTFSINDYRKANKDYQFNTQHIDFANNSTMYLYTDGFQDQFGGKDNKKFKKKRWRTLLLKASAKPIEQQKLFLENNLSDWMGNNSQVDDILVMGVQL